MTSVTIFCCTKRSIHISNATFWCAHIS